MSTQDAEPMCCPRSKAGLDHTRSLGSRPNSFSEFPSLELLAPFGLHCGGPPRVKRSTWSRVVEMLPRTMAAVQKPYSRVVDPPFDSS